MSDKYRFIGLRSFETDEQELLFERQDAVNQVFKSVKFNKLTLIHSKAGSGKTSILKAGLLPIIQKDTSYKCFFVSVANYIKKHPADIFEQINNQIKDEISKNSYLDKIIEPEETLWYKFKRVEATSDATILLIFDQFENIFSYNETQINLLKNELQTLLYEQIPIRLRDSVNEKLSKNKDILTSSGLKKLYENINIKIVISIRTDKLDKIEYFNDVIPFLSNQVEIQPITVENTKNIIEKTASFLPKYNIDNNLISKPFTVDKELINSIIKYLTKNNSEQIEAYQLQIIGQEIEKISIEKTKTEITINDIPDFDDIYTDYYENVISKIENNEQQISARKFIEDELIFEYEKRKITIYEGIAELKYSLTPQTIKYLIDNHLIVTIVNKKGDVFYEISHDALINPILFARNKRIKYEINIQQELAQKKKLEEEAIIQKNKNKRITRFAVVFSLLFIIASVLGVYAKIQKNKAEKQETLYKSTLYASYSLNLLDEDPTLSFRLAQKAYNVDNQNFIALKSLLKSFYKTNVFYGIIDTIKDEFTEIRFTDDGTKYFLINNGADKYLVLKTIAGDTLCEIKVGKMFNTVKLINDDEIFVSLFNGSMYLYDFQGNILKEFSHGSFVNSVSFSKDKKKFISCGNNNIAKLWSVSGSLLRQFAEHQAVVTVSAFSDDGKFIATVDVDNNIFIRDSSLNIVAKYTYYDEVQNQKTMITSVNFSPNDSSLLIVLNDDRTNTHQFKIFNTNSQKITTEYKDFSGFINSAEYIDSNKILVYTKNGIAEILNLKNNNSTKFIGHSGEIFDMFYNSKTSEFTSVSADRTIRNWKFYVQNKDVEKYAGSNLVKYSNTGSYIALAGSSFILFDLFGKNIFSLDKYISNVYFSPNDNYAVLVSFSSVFVVDILNKESNFISLPESVLFANFSADNSKIFIITEKNILTYSKDCKLLSTKQIDCEINSASSIYNQIYASNEQQLLKLNTIGKIVDTLSISGIKYLKNSTNKNFKLIAFSDNELYVIGMDFNILRTISNDAVITCADISTNNNFYVLGDENGNCYLFDKNYNKIINFKQDGRIMNVQFSPNEKTLLINFITGDIKTQVKTYIISPTEIDKYVDDLNLYGNVQIFKDLDCFVNIK